MNLKFLTHCSDYGRLLRYCRLKQPIKFCHPLGTTIASVTNFNFHCNGSFTVQFLEIHWYGYRINHYKYPSSPAYRSAIQAALPARLESWIFLRRIFAPIKFLLIFAPRQKLTSLHAKLFSPNLSQII